MPVFFVVTSHLPSCPVKTGHLPHSLKNLDPLNEAR